MNFCYLKKYYIYNNITYIMEEINKKISNLYEIIADIQLKLLENKEHKDSTAVVRQEHGDSINSISATIVELIQKVNSLEERVDTQQIELESAHSLINTLRRS